MTTDGLRAATDKMREAGVPELAVSVFSQLPRAAPVAGDRAPSPRTRIDPLTEVAAPRRRAARRGRGGAGARPDRRHQAQRRARHEHGHPRPEVGAAGARRADLPRHHRPAGARAAAAARGADAAAAHGLLPHPGGVARASSGPTPDLAVDGLPLDFLQNKEPKLRADDLGPVEWPDDPDLEWCPPGHGDVYVALQTTGLLDALRERGYRYAFLSNADNLGATCEGAVPAWMAREGIPYVTEVCARTRNDRKGGHLGVRRSDGRLVLRDSAMVGRGRGPLLPGHRPAPLVPREQPLGRPRRAGRAPRRARRHPRPADHRQPQDRRPDPARTARPVIQIESAMGAAVEVFDGSRALAVDRSRFRPVKTTNELLLIRSDLYRLTDDSLVESTIDHDEPFIDLAKPYSSIDGFEERFPHGVPSIRDCSSLRVEADATFGAGVVCTGDVRVTGGVRTIPDGAHLEGDV